MIKGEAALMDVFPACTVFDLVINIELPPSQSRVDKKHPSTLHLHLHLLLIWQQKLT